MKLVSQVIAEAPIVLNPEGQLTLQLRNLQIPYLENLELTEDKFRVIDLTSNELRDLDNIPKLKNLEVLLVAGNEIRDISTRQEDLFVKSLPLLKSLSLINNKIKTFYNLKALSKSSITDLALSGNTVTKLSNYRLFIIWLVPTLKVLDFNKVKESERIEAIKQFGTLEEPNELAISLLNGGDQVDSNHLPRSPKFPLSSTKKLSDKEKVELLHKLETAESIDEIEKIEGMLKA